MADTKNPQADGLRKLAAEVRALDAKREAVRMTKAAQVLSAAKGLLTLRQKVQGR